MTAVFAFLQSSSKKSIKRVFTGANLTAYLKFGEMDKDDF